MIETQIRTSRRSGVDHRLPADRAYQVGLTQEVFDDHESLVGGVLEIAAEIASKSPLAIWGTKEMLNYSRDHSVADGLNYIDSWVESNFDRCFQLMECHDQSLFDRWMVQWRDLIDFEIVPVMTSQEASARR